MLTLASVAPFKRNPTRMRLRLETEKSSWRTVLSPAEARELAADLVSVAQEVEDQESCNRYVGCLHITRIEG